MDVHPMVEGLFLLFSTYKNLSSKKNNQNKNNRSDKT